MTTNKELMEKYGISETEIAEMETSADAYDRDEWPEGSVHAMGRPFLYGERMKSVTYRDTAEEVSRMDDRAASLDMSRSDYLRYLVRQDLATA